MNTRQTVGASRILPIRFYRWSALITVMLLGATMLLSACGGGEAEPVAVPTEVPTMAAPAATEAPEATEAATTPEVTESEGVTETEGVDDSETTTDTEGVDDSEAVTETEGVDGSETLTDTEGVDDSEAVTETGAAAGAEDVALMGVSGVDAKQYVRASTLLDYDFENLDGEVSGDLEDLLIDLDTGRVLFASIEYGGVLDLGDKDIVIPLNAFTTGPEGQLVLNIDEATLENYPDVGNDWPDLNDPVWDDDVNAYWTETGINVGTGFDEPAANVAWASDLMGYNVADLGFGAGSILDILVNLGTGHAPYFIVDYGEGLATNPVIVPVAAFDLTDWSTEFVYGPDFTPDILERAPSFDQDAYPEGSDLDIEFGDRLESAWNDLGFSNDLNNDGEIDTGDVDDSEVVTETSTVDDAAPVALMGVSGVDAKQYVRASTLLDYDFENLDGEVSGDLEDLLIDLDTGRVLFASIEYGGVLDLGDKDIVIPLNAFTTGPEGQLVLNIDEATLENYPDVGNDWPDLNDPVWDDDVNAYWTETGINVGTGFDEPATNVAWASDLMGYNVADLGFGAGSILDILVNLGTGHAPYFIIDYGEGLATNPVIVPLAAFDLTDWSTEFVYGPDFTPDILERAPSFDQDAYPEGSPLDIEFGDRLESAWNDLGFSNDLNNDGEID